MSWVFHGIAGSLVHSRSQMESPEFEPHPSSDWSVHKSLSLEPTHFASTSKIPTLASLQKSKDRDSFQVVKTRVFLKTGVPKMAGAPLF